MSRRRHTPDQIIRKVAEGHKLLAGGTDWMVEQEIEGVLVDRCATHGIWFDSGELERALQHVHKDVGVMPVDWVRTAWRVLNGDHHTFFSRKVWQVFGDELRYLSARCGLCLRLYLRRLGAGHEPDHHDAAEHQKCQRHNQFDGPHTSTLRFSDVIRHGDALHMDYSRRQGWGS